MSQVRELPQVIQGGMGVGVSSWELARSVSCAGGLGVVSGTALDVVLARRLQDGDRGGHLRRALAAFPEPGMARRVRDRYFQPDGRPDGGPYRPVPKLTLRQTAAQQELAVVANFVEVWLAKDGHDAPVGVNYLEKVQMATPAAALGALVAGVDYVLMGAGLPRQIPRLLDDLAAGVVAGVDVDVHGADEPHRVTVDPRALLAEAIPDLARPQFLAIVSANILAAYLARDPSTCPDGFVVEGPGAGGHNAPPRGRLTLDERNEPVYGPRDEVDIDKLRALGIPFWLAGGEGTPQGLAEARARGAAGIQVGTLFALAADSGLTPSLREELGDRLDSGTLDVRTDPLASPTGFPFKVAQVVGTLSDPSVYDERRRLCDLSYLRTPYLTPSGGIGYRCPGEPEQMYVRKGGDLADTVGRACLCNALTADIGLGQTRRDGYVEPPLVTLGSDLTGAEELASIHPNGWAAADVVAWLTGA
ncbi:2-nitropropane dioxygenase [Nocardioides szechwanensis]|uniref:NAD(P)H-dependent flavin oxidoreductase YrpB, nitropropane dioxygenase family n=1 Tax=Nocardioides szechwanensis TaxID=1005944 RepID=A0A1G9ZDK3_9ACTN|nr:nitronate monooxygenase [Nocardioides szechwanensis]GEP33899.1 2-nitropropane dioxygenase [Nocardioides szechwanensis]SDN19294.1 NAD(P)H-dependent flavin oxidoreductase YrpB, nitropropane dioxygenase family [Nocardioides szechwanensis]